MPLGNQTSAHEWKMPPESRHPTGQLTFLWVLTTGASHKRVKGKNSCLILNARAWYGRVRPPIRCACGEIGRRARLRIWCRKAYRFESCQAHHLCPSLSKQLEGGFLFMVKNWTLSSRFRPYLTRYFRHANYIMHGYLAAM